MDIMDSSLIIWAFFIAPGAGIVLEIGSAVTTVSKGDRVLLSFSHCETCAQCISGHPAYCHTFNDRNFGGQRPDGTKAMMQSLEEDKENNDNKVGSGPSITPVHSTFFGQSSFARHTLVHKSSLVKVPLPETDLALFAALGCGIQTGAGAVLNTLDIQPGSTIAVFGVGSVGMSAVMAAKLRQAKTIIAVDMFPERLNLAKRLGATHGIIGSDVDVVRQIQKLSPPLGVDFAVDCTGVPAVVRTMIDALGSRGKGATVGAPGFGVCVSVNIMDQLTFGRSYVGCCEGDSLPSEVSTLCTSMGSRLAPFIKRSYNC
jgi:Zn-dependent alcohol dehydrogenase